MAGHGHVEHSGENKRVALLIAVLALCLAIAETGAKSAQTEALSRNVEASNLWAFFQARTIRQTTVRTAAENLALAPESEDEARRAATARQIQAWMSTAQRWDSEPSTGEGRKELAERARAAERIRDRSMAAYHMHEYGSAAFQVAIVVASASIVTGVPLLAVGGAVLGLVGVALAGLGFFAPELIHF
ncbi:DUF4337 domain-containing protein [Roseomonas sp. SSH11]|uniref:DUF4337 domain-containing protein n=1 Tax=Pararoseomonas baculiformis TaxID=2820812 RepID=A0ABS4AGP4_9PROT|nr:DUF4337 domain-containing protein [Pararoseomonas baculiformis]MBP0446180.1 DUF4337 domain-containing protein [Pararoseomonas baculiformis]